MRHWNVFVYRFRLHSKRPCRFLPRGRGHFFVFFKNWKYRVDFLPFKGMCVTGREPRDYGLAVTTRGAVHWEIPSMKRRDVKLQGADVKHLAAMETNLFQDLLPLVEHCAVRQYDDGSPRETGWLTIKTQGAAWVVQVKDPDAAVSFTAIADSLDKALQSAALLLACEEAPWEADGFLAAQKARRGKK